MKGTNNKTAVTTSTFFSLKRIRIRLTRVHDWRSNLEQILESNTCHFCKTDRQRCFTFTETHNFQRDWRHNGTILISYECKLHSNTNSQISLGGTAIRPWRSASVHWSSQLTLWRRKSQCKSSCHTDCLADQFETDHCNESQFFQVSPKQKPAMVLRRRNKGTVFLIIYAQQKQTLCDCMEDRNPDRERWHWSTQLSFKWHWKLYSLLFSQHFHPN